MIGVDMKGLIDKCDSLCVQALHTAAGLTVDREHYEVTCEHFLLACLQERNSDLALILQGAGIDTAVLERELKRTLSALRSGNTGRPVFSPGLQDLLEAGWLVSSVDLKARALRSGGALLAFLRRPGFYAQGDYTALLRATATGDILRDFARLTQGSCEADADRESETSGDGEGGSPAGESRGGEGFIARFCEDFTVKAREGKLDPVFGRDREIRQMVDILARRRKNNPILVGEPGVGKTAVIEGLALRIAEGDVPETLRGNVLLGLDIGLLEAGASVKGEFERRLKGVLDEIKASSRPVILFIDEAHLLVGAGNSAGGSDAANLMKPALARGEIRTCAATTWKEYKKYFEKDPALARRFQLVRLDEPSVATTALILRGLRDSYEKAHNVLVRDEAMQAAADYAGRYISGRFLPDKAIDLLDTACARVKVSQAARPGPLEDAQRRAQACERQLAALDRDAAEGADIDAGRRQALEEERQEALAEAAALEARWQEERALADRVLEARAVLTRARAAAAAATEAPEAADTQKTSPDAGTAPAKAPEAAATPGTAATQAPEAAATPAPAPEAAGAPDTAETLVSVDEAARALREARQALQALQAGEPLVSVEVTADVVAQVVSSWTGIPVGKVARDEASRIADLDRTLAARIRGQDMALRSIVEGIQAGKAGLRAPEQPLGVFLLVGPSGVGKTETGLALADALFGDEGSLVPVNMSEFQEKHTVSRLVGSPPGYVGYGEGGRLTEAVRRKPYSVVMLDEVEKAHPDVMQLFYQVFDKGVLTDGEGTEVSFRNTVIMLTSNLGSEITQALCEDPDNMPSSETVAQALRPLLSSHFQPALLARMTIVPYVSLTPAALAAIAGLKLGTLAGRLAANNGMACTWDDDVPAWLASRCVETETGARNVDYILAGSVLPRLARDILSRMADETPPGKVHLALREGELVLLFGSADAAQADERPADEEPQGDARA